MLGTLLNFFWSWTYSMCNIFNDLWQCLAGFLASRLGLSAFFPLLQTKKRRHLNQEITCHRPRGVTGYHLWQDIPPTFAWHNRVKLPCDMMWHSWCSSQSFMHVAPEAACSCKFEGVFASVSRLICRIFRQSPCTRYLLSLQSPKEAVQMFDWPFKGIWSIIFKLTLSTYVLYAHWKFKTCPSISPL